MPLDLTITTNATALWHATGTNITALTVVPSTVGSLLVLGSTHATAGTITAVTGGGCNSSSSGLPGAWARITGPFTNGSTGFDMELWMARITTTGSTTVTITGGAGGTVRIICKQFNCAAGGVNTVWTRDGSAGTEANTATSTNVTFPTLTPTGVNRLYVGYGMNGTGLTTGATAGYTVELDDGTNPMIYNPSVAQSAQSPISKQSASAVSYTTGAVIKADHPTGSFLPLFL
jgi:hypothetical protein